MMDTQTLPPLPEARIESYQIDGTMRRTTLHTYSGQDMRDYALAAIALASPAAPAQAVPPFAWATHHAPPMIFLTQKEAAAYCDDDEQPIPLYEAPAAQVPAGSASDKRVDSLVAALNEIGDYAHDCSTGPAVPDALWEIRRMAYEAMDLAAVAAPPAVRLPLTDEQIDEAWAGITSTDDADTFRQAVRFAERYHSITGEPEDDPAPAVSPLEAPAQSSEPIDEAAALDHFEAKFQEIEVGDGDITLPTPGDGRRWDDYVERHKMALTGWVLRREYEELERSTAKAWTRFEAALDARTAVPTAQPGAVPEGAFNQWFTSDAAHVAARPDEPVDYTARMAQRAFLAASPPAPQQAVQTVRMLTEAELADLVCTAAPFTDSMVTARFFQLFEYAIRKFCEVNGLPLATQQTGKEG